MGSLIWLKLCLCSLFLVILRYKASETISPQCFIAISVSYLFCLLSLTIGYHLLRFVPDDQVIRTNQTNILIRSLTLMKQKGDSSSKDGKGAASGQGSRKRYLDCTYMHLSLIIGSHIFSKFHFPGLLRKLWMVKLLERRQQFLALRMDLLKVNIILSSYVLPLNMKDYKNRKDLLLLERPSFMLHILKRIVVWSWRCQVILNKLFWSQQKAHIYLLSNILGTCWFGSWKFLLSYLKLLCFWNMPITMKRDWIALGSSFCKILAANLCIIIIFSWWNSHYGKRTELQLLTVEKLRALLREKGLSATGRKASLPLLI